MLRDVGLFEQRMTQMAARLRAMSPFDVENAKAFNTAIANLQQSLSTLQNTVGAELAPAFTAAADALDRLLNENKVQLSERFARDFGLAAAAAEKIKALGEAVGSVPLIGPGAAQVGKDLFDPIGMIMRDLETIGSYLGVGGAQAAEAPKGRSPYGSLAGIRQQFEDTKKGTKEGVLDALREWSGLGGGGGELAGGAPAAIGTGGLGGRGMSASRRAPLGGGGGTPRAAAPVGGERLRLAKESYDFWRSQGYSHAAAMGLVAQEAGESGFNPTAVGDNGRSVGSFQWDATRRAKIAAATGIRIPSASHIENLRAAAWELNNSESTAGAAIRGSKTVAEAVSAGVRLYERSRYQGRDITVRTGIAMGLERDFAKRPPPPQPKPGTVLKSSGAFGLGGPNYAAAGAKAAVLNVNVTAPGNVKTSADGGDHFKDISVKRSRPMADRGDWGN